MTRVFHRLAAFAALVLCFSAPAFAQTYTYSLYIDSDNNAATGCTVSVPGGSIAGAETLLTGTVTASAAPQVNTLTVSACSGGSFGVPTATGSGAVDVGAGSGGSTSIEFSSTLPALVGSNTGNIRLFLVAQSTAGSDVLLTTNGAAGGAPILFALASSPTPGGGLIPAPMLGIPMALLLIAGLLWFGSRAARQRWMARVLIGMVLISGIAGAAIFNWSGFNPIATDAVGDATSGETAIDLRSLFAAVSNGNLYFRFDVSGNLAPPAQPPVAVADSYTTSLNTALNTPAPGVLGNDTLNTATITGHSNPVHGTLTLNADGSFVYTPTSGYVGADSFTYTISNSGGASTGSVSLSVITGPVAIADSYATSVGTALSVPANGVLGNDQLGTPTASLSSFGGGSLGGAVTDHATGTSAALAGGTLTLNADGSLNLTAPTIPGTYLFQYRIGNVQGNSDGTVTVQVNQAPTISSPDSTTFVVGSPGNFIVSVGATPTATITRSGAALPVGVSFVDNGNGSATLAGLPGTGNGGSYVFTITASNGVGSPAVQTFTLTVDEAPAITSAGSTAFSVGAAGSFNVTTRGFPAPALAVTGTLPTGVSFNAATGTLSGTPSAGSAGVYPLTITASNGIGGVATQNFALTVQVGPAFTSAASATFVVGTADSFTITTTATPTATLSETGALPSGLGFSDNGDGTAKLSGTADAATGGTYSLTLSASNGIGAPATQSFTLQVNEVPLAAADAYTAVTGVMLTVAAPGVLANDTLGTPAAVVQAFGGGTLGGAVTDNAAGASVSLAGGTLTIAADGSVSLTAPTIPGSYTVQYRIGNIAGTADATITFTINQPPQIGSGTTANFVVGTNSSFSITTTGTPTVNSITLTGCTLPSGLSFSYTSGATATISGSASAGGPATCTITASNGVGSAAIQTLTVTANSGPAPLDDSFTTVVGTTLSVTAPGALTNDALGFPAATLTAFGGGSLGGSVTDHAAGSSVALAGGSLTINADGSLSLSAPSTPGTYTVMYQVTNTQGSASATITLQVNQAPAIISPNNVTFLISASQTFTISTTGTPTATSIGLSGCSLPTGLAFAYVSGANATISGTPTVSGNVSCTITAANGVSPYATQTLTIAVNAGPSAVADALSTTINTTLNVAAASGLLANDTLGNPLATLSSFGGNSLAGSVTTNAAGASVPLAGGTLTVNADGSLTLSAPSVAGQYTFLYRIGNGVSTSDAMVTLNVNQPATITSANAATFIAAQANNFSVTTSGFPQPSLSATGSLPAGLSFVDNGNGSATLSGSPPAGSAGSYALTITAHNGIGVDATQSFTLQINQAPAFTSAAAATFVVGSAGSFNVSASGTPAASFTATGSLPSGVTLGSSGLLSGTPGPGTGGSYPLTLTASNGIAPNATQSFVLTVNQAAAITSAASTTFIAGTAGTFSVTTTGFPKASISQTGALPSGVTLVDNANGTATLSGTPAAASGGTYAFTITAHNGVGTDASQSFSLQVNQAPTITSAATTTFTAGSPGTFNVTATGTPSTFTFSKTGTLPAGITLSAAGVLGGTPAPGSGGSYPITITASNTVNPNATQSFTLIVNQAPAITSAASASFPIGVADNFTVTASGFPLPTFSATGTLPGGVSLSTAGALAGTPAPGSAGTYPLSITASNGIGSPATQAFTLTVTCPTITVSGTLPNALYQTPYTSPAFTQTGGAAPITWSAPALPFTLAINASTGVVSGTPSNTVAAASVVVTVTDANLCTGALTVNNFKIAPVAAADSYTTIGNTALVAGAGAPATPYLASATKLIANDSGPGTLSVPAGTSASANGGNVVLASDGSFVFTPSAGSTATDTFTYVLTDGNGVTSAPATVSIAIANKVWYVNGVAGTNGSGVSSNPFNTLASASSAHVAGDFIFVESGATPSTTPGAISLKPAATLWGQGVALPPISGLSILNTAATSKPKLTGTVTLTAGAGEVVSSLDIATTTAPGLTNTGTVTTATVQNNVTVTSTTGTAVALTNAGGNFTFKSISANGAGNGIALSATTGTFTVQGDGGAASNGSGGTIQNSTGAGVLLSSAAGVSLNYLNLTNNGASAINGTTLSGFSLNHDVITDASGGASDDGVQLTNASGSVAITNSSIAGVFRNGVTVANSAGTATLNITANTIGPISGTNANDGVYIFANGSAFLGTSTLYANTFSGIFATAIQVQADGAANLSNFAIGAPGLVNTFTNNNLGIDIDQSGNATGSFAVMNNSFSGHASHAINVFSNDTLSTGGGLTGQIENNTIGKLGTLDSGSTGGDGIRVASYGGAANVLTISGNSVSEVPNGRGLDITGAHGSGGSGSLKVKVASNTVNKLTGAGTAGNVCGVGVGVPCPLASIWVASDNFTTGGTGSVCAIVSGNTAYDPTVYTFGSEAAYYLQQNTFTGPSLFSLGGTKANANAEISATNTVTNSASSPVVIDGTVNIVAAATCGTFPP